MADGYGKQTSPKKAGSTPRAQNSTKENPGKKENHAQKKNKKAWAWTPGGTTFKTPPRNTHGVNGVLSPRQNHSTASRSDAQAIQGANRDKRELQEGVRRGPSCRPKGTDRDSIRNGHKKEKYCYGDFSAEEPLRIQGRRPGRGSGRTDQSGNSPGNFGALACAAGSIHGPGRRRALCSTGSRYEEKDCTNREKQGSCTAPEIKEIIKEKNIKMTIGAKV